MQTPDCRSEHDDVSRGESTLQNELFGTHRVSGVGFALKLLENTQPTVRCDLMAAGLGKPLKAEWAFQVQGWDWGTTGLPQTILGSGSEQASGCTPFGLAACEQTSWFF
jgi:hypothetical protein